MRKLGFGHIAQSIEAQIILHQDCIKRLENMREINRSLAGIGSSDETASMDEQDSQIIKRFIEERFHSRHKNAEQAVNDFSQDPKLWTENLNDLLYLRLRPAALIKKIREAYQ